MMPGSVSDFRSHPDQQVTHAVKVIGRSVARRKVFAAIYHHKSKAKTVSWIVGRTRLPKMRVLQEGRHLVKEEVVGQSTKDGQIAYEMYQTLHRRKRQILSLVANPKGLRKLAAKRNIVIQLPNVVSVPSAGAKVRRVYVDDIASFAKVKRIRGSDRLPDSISEDQFKRGVQRIVGEPGTFKDWPGERSDLYTTRIRLNGQRVAAAFAFKGPGLRGKLVLGKMGVHGDQLPRLFQEEAEAFFVQHWREIDPLIAEAMRSFAVAKSVTTGKRIWFGTIDGKDSHRLVLAYPMAFASTANGRKKRPN